MWLGIGTGDVGGVVQVPSGDVMRYGAMHATGPALAPLGAAARFVSCRTRQCACGKEDRVGVDKCWHGDREEYRGTVQSR